MDPDHLARFHAFNHEPKSEAHKQAISDAQPSKGGTHKPEHLRALQEAMAAVTEARAKAAGFQDVGFWRAQLAEKARETERQRKITMRAEAKELGMSKRAFDEWEAAGRPEDMSPYLKNSPKSRSLKSSATKSAASSREITTASAKRTTAVG